ncbi:MAG: hypothetical protein CBC34_006190 [Hyphomicrobiaceae bacterium TMED74]|nr:hypothetical protein [Filomicrobium sp.]RPG43736.1 MAG: hypothetical protein CBC34_006190 [Hyphomicrobiaceae bacterium TMED74]
MTGGAKKDQLPKGWVIATLGELLPLEYGKALPSRKRNSNGQFSVYGSSGIVGTHTAAVVSEPAIIVGRKGSAGRVHLSKDPCWPIDTCITQSPLMTWTSTTGLTFSDSRS